MSEKKTISDRRPGRRRRARQQNEGGVVTEVYRRMTREVYPDAE